MTEEDFGVPKVTSMREYVVDAMRVRANDGLPMDHMRNCGMGLVTEMGELVDLHKRYVMYKVNPDHVSLTEEIGDLLWYIALGVTTLEVEIVEDPVAALGDATRPGLNLTMAKMVRYTSNVFSVVHAYPETALDSGLDYDLKQLLLTTVFFCEHFGIDIFEAATANLIKMKKRYPNGFNIVDAVNRDKEHELSHIKANYE